MIDFLYLDDKPMHSFQRRKGPSWCPIHAYFLAMEQIENSESAMGSENWKLIRSNGVVINEDSIHFDRSQPKNGKRVYFDLFDKESVEDTLIVEYESAIR